MVTLKDIARECNVSLATVSKALNGQSDVSLQTAFLIKEKAKQFGYLPNAAARSLKTNRSHNLGVLFVDKTSSGLRHEYFSEILNSVKVESEIHGYDITFITRDLGTHSMTYCEHAFYRNCDGVIIATVDFKDPGVLALVDSRIPTVTLDHVFDGCTSVLSDNVGGMTQIVEYLYEKGHRNIGIIHGEDTAVTQKRMASFRKTCEKVGIQISEEHIKTSMYHDPKGTALATKELLSMKNKPTCIIFPDDFSAIGGMNEIEKQGYLIPEDISVIGYDGILLSQVIRPKLTTYKQDAEKMGKIAASILIEEIENPKVFIPQQIVVEGKLLEGGTVKQI